MKRSSAREVRNVILCGLCIIMGTAEASAQSRDVREMRRSQAGVEEITILGQEESLTVLGAEAACTALERTPGGVDLVTDEEFRGGRAVTLKDVLDYVPGVYVQPKFGEDARFSIRGSGLSRNFHLRGVRLLLDGVPINTSDGSGDFQEIEPLAAQYVEVYKGANALEKGASYLGGAVNLVMATGRDAPALLGRFERGSFGYTRGQLATGGASGKWDYFVTGTMVEQDGFRQHSTQDNMRLSANVGLRSSESVESRFYLTYNNIDQEIPGSVARVDALRSPDRAAPSNIRNDQKRDIESTRFGHKTSIDLSDATRLTLGSYALFKHLDHPIFQVIDSRYRDFGGFSTIEHQREIAGRTVDLLWGLQLSGGNTEARRFVNVQGSRGAPTADAEERAVTTETYAQARIELVPSLSLIAGGHYTHAIRSIEDEFLADDDDSDRRLYREFSPRVGFVWEPDARWQLFGNVSRSAEVPTFSELNPTAAPGFADLETQKAVTYEIGARGRSEGVIWDVSLYRAELRDELQLFDLLGNGSSSARNADRSLHQGVEAGLELRLAEGIIATGDRSDAIWLKQSYTLSDFRFDDDAQFGGNDLPGAPRHYYRSELAYQHPDGVSVSLNLEWVPKGYYVDNQNTVKTEDYALLGFRVGVPLPGNMTLFVDGRNLLDRKYIASTSVIPVATPDRLAPDTPNGGRGSTLFNPGEGRAIYVGIEIRR